MVELTLDDFSIQSARQRDQTREKLDLLGQALSKRCTEVCPKRKWGHYVTGKAAYEEQWGAIYPIPVHDYQDLMVSFPCIFYNIPQDGGNVGLYLNIEFKGSRDTFAQHLFGRHMDALIIEFQKASNAKVRVWRKGVQSDNKRNYYWEGHWDDKELPDIDVSACSPDYLQKYKNLTQAPTFHPNPEFEWEPIFLVGYEIEPHIFIKGNPEQILGEKIKLIAPILEYITWGLV